MVNTETCPSESPSGQLSEGGSDRNAGNRSSRDTGKGDGGGRASRRLGKQSPANPYGKDPKTNDTDAKQNVTQAHGNEAGSGGYTGVGKADGHSIETDEELSNRWIVYSLSTFLIARRSAIGFQ